MYVVQDRYLGPEYHAIPSYRTLELDFDHVTSAHPPTLGHTVNQGLIQIDDEGLLWRVGIISHDIGGLSPRNERAWRGRGSRVLELCGGRVGGRLQRVCDSGDLILFGLVCICGLALTSTAEGVLVVVQLDANRTFGRGYLVL